jgi:RsiW-degrading membrane proteinase PrsW (M82 family)
MGYYLGKAKFSASNNRVYLLLALIIPISLHGVYDYILVSQKFWVYFIMPFMIYLWWLGMKKVKKARLLSDFHAEKLSQNHYLSK